MTTATSQQVMNALALANDIRSKRAAEKREIASLPMREGRAVVAALLEDTPAWLQSETIGRLLSYPRSTGRAYATRMLLYIANPHWPVGENTRIRQLTPAQRSNLAKMLRDGWGPNA